MNRIPYFLSDKSGAIAIIFALVLVPVVLGVGLAVDYGSWVRDRSHMQSIADASALAGARALTKSGATPSIAKSIAEAVADAHNVGSVSGFSKGVNVTEATKEVSVTVTKPGQRTFSAFALSSDPPISVTSTAKVVGGAGEGVGQYAGLCVLALDPRMDRSLQASGGSLVWAKDCWVQVNSTSSKAVNFSGNSVLRSGRNCFVGGVDQGLSLMSPTPEPDCAAMPDPFENTQMPVVNTCDYTDHKISGGSPVLSPGVYCGGLTLSSVTKATLMPGLYVIKDGQFTMSGGGILEGNGVTLALTGNKAGLNWSGGGSYHLVAPATGQPGMPGFLVFLDRFAAANSKSVISGTGQMYYEGILYFPTQQVEVSGTGLTEALASPFTIYVAKNFVYSGGSEMVVNADAPKTSVHILPEFQNTGGAGGVSVSLSQ